MSSILPPEIPSQAGAVQQTTPEERLTLVLSLIQRPQTSVANTLGITGSYLSQMKSTTSSSSLSHLVAMKLEKTFGISADWLMDGGGVMIANLEKARAYMAIDDIKRSPDDPAVLQLTLRDNKGRVRSGTARAGLRDYPSPTGGEEWVEVPVLDMPVADRPEASPHFRGLRVKLPAPDALDLYCIEAGPYAAAGFRQGDYLLIERRPSSQWQADEVHGKICAARRRGKEMWQLLELRLVGGVPPAQVRMRSLSGSPQFREALWEDLEIAGVVRMSFRTQLSRAVPWVQQTDLFAGGAADLDDA